VGDGCEKHAPLSLLLKTLVLHDSAKLQEGSVQLNSCAEDRPIAVVNVSPANRERRKSAQNFAHMREQHLLLLLAPVLDRKQKRLPSATFRGELFCRRKADRVS
jgi:hypothetical protein